MYRYKVLTHGDKICSKMAGVILKKVCVKTKIKSRLIVEVFTLGLQGMAQHNFLHRRIMVPTDIITIRYHNFRELRHYSRRTIILLGEIYFCLEYIKQKGYRVLPRVYRMLIHGYLHLLGYDHKGDEEARVMEGLEKQLLEDIRINFNCELST